MKNNNKISYFDGKWANITREERYFCAELFYDIKNDINGFIKFLNNKFNKNYNTGKYWEAGFEVCFYRDYLFAKGERVKDSTYSVKRTFDLCLFSETNIIIIEAKAYQNFKSAQLINLEADLENVRKVLGKNTKELKVEAFLLCSSTNHQVIGTFEKFTWEDLYSDFNSNEIYLTADALPSREKPNK